MRNLATLDYLTVAAEASDSRISVKGELFNANPGQRVQVDLQRHDGVSFRLVRTVNATVTAFGDYSAGFAHTAGDTTCRAVARYAGDADSLAVTRAVVFAC